MASVYAINGKILYSKKGANHRETVISAIKEGISLGLADLSYLDLTGVKFDCVSLVAADLSGSQLRGCSFVRTDLTGAKLDSASASGVNFSNSGLLRASFKGSNLELALFCNTYIKSADFSGANLWGANFCNASAHDTDMSSANIYDADFTLVDLSTVNFEGAIVGFCDEVRGRRRAKLVKALNKGELVVNKYGWRIDLAGPGCPTKWVRSWDTVMICVDKKDENDG